MTNNATDPDPEDTKMTTLETMAAKLEALTLAARDRLAEIRTGNRETLAHAIREFEAINAERVELMGLLNLVPVAR